MKNHQKSRSIAKAKTHLWEIDLTCARNLIFLFSSICSKGKWKKNLSWYSHDCSTRKTFKESLLYTMSHVKRGVGGENSIGALILSRYRWKRSNWKRVERWSRKRCSRHDDVPMGAYDVIGVKRRRKKKWCNGTRKFSD